MWKRVKIYEFQRNFLNWRTSIFCIKMIFGLATKFIYWLVLSEYFALIRNMNTSNGDACLFLWLLIFSEWKSFLLCMFYFSILVFIVNSFNQLIELNIKGNRKFSLKYHILIPKIKRKIKEKITTQKSY